MIICLQSLDVCTGLGLARYPYSTRPAGRQTRSDFSIGPGRTWGVIFPTGRAAHEGWFFPTGRAAHEGWFFQRVGPAHERWFFERAGPAKREKSFLTAESGYKKRKRIILRVSPDWQNKTKFWNIIPTDKSLIKNLFSRQQMCQWNVFFSFD